MIYFGILKTLNSYTYCVLIQKHNYTIINTKSNVTTTKLCQVLVASLVSMVKVEEFMETYVRDSKYEGSYKADCSLTTDRNINTCHRGHLHAVQRYNSHSSRFYHDFIILFLILSAGRHNWNSLISEAWPLHYVIGHAVFNTCWFVFLCHPKMRRVVTGCLMLVYVVALLAEQAEGHIAFFSPKEMRELRVRRPSAS